MKKYPLPPGAEAGPLILVKVRNVGGKPVTITTLALAVYRSRWERYRRKSSYNAFVPSPGGAKPLPHKLDVGDEWMGYVRQDKSIQQYIDQGVLWFEIYHSWGRHPIRGRVGDIL